MTIRTRNRLFFSIFIVCLLSFLTIVSYFIYAGFNSMITQPEMPYRIFNKFRNSMFFSYNFWYSIAGIYAITFYTALSSILIYISFEKTQSIEVTYFMFFIIGCLFEAVRIALPINNLWKSSSTNLLFIGRLIITGRIICPVSLMFGSLFSENNQRQYLERNIVFLLVISIVLAMMLPLDSYHVTSTLAVLWGRRTLFRAVLVAICLLTFTCLLINTITKRSKENLGLTIGYAVLMIGYNNLISADNLFFLIAGGVFLTAGTILYLRSIHKLYLWK